MKMKNYLMELILTAVRNRRRRIRIDICISLSVIMILPIAVNFPDGSSQLNFLIHDFINVTKAFATDLAPRYDL